MTDIFFIEIKSDQKNHESERICGDVFLTEKIKEENRIIAVLSDGLGHGVKANVLATLTAKMALSFTKEHKDFNKIAEIIMNTLPVCSERKISYSTFTILDIEINGKTRILEYENPPCFILRDGKPFDPGWEIIALDGEKYKDRMLRSCSFYPKKEDRIILVSDGISQAGMGSRKYPFGWGHDQLSEYVENLVNNQPNISAHKLAVKVVNMANQLDNYHSKDDSSCVSVYFREPRKLLICTGPPYEREKDLLLANMVREFKGKKIVCGATTADIISRELNIEITDSFEFTDEELPPVSVMEGIDLVTEGILTLSKVNTILNNYNKNTVLGNGPADQIVKLIRKSDEIHFVIGTRINIAHQDPNLPIDLEIRRTVVRRIARVLEEKFLKQVTVRFI